MLKLLLIAQLAFSGPQWFNITSVTNGFDYYLIPAEMAPDIAGREIVLFIPSFQLITAGRWHPSKHGIGGLLNGPGLCVEGWTSFTIDANAWNTAITGDMDGDNITDWLVYSTAGNVILHKGLPLSACR
jgi:hypothetical protein